MFVCLSPCLLNNCVPLAYLQLMEATKSASKSETPLDTHKWLPALDGVRVCIWDKGKKQYSFLLT